MLVTFFKDDIIEGLHKAANIIPAKTGAAFLRTIWVKAEESGLQIMATDSNLEFFGSYQATIKEDGLAGIQGRNFYDLVKRLPAGEATLVLEEKGKNMQVKQGSRKYNLPTNDPDWFQNFSVFPETGALSISGEFLLEIIDRVSFCISEDDTMEAVACISIKPVPGEKKVEVCGLNGHQFAMIDSTDPDFIELVPEEGILIQRKYLMELKKWLSADPIECAIDNKRLFCRTADGKETFSLPLSYYQYPDYHNFLSRLQGEDATRASVDRQDVAEALERMLLFNTENNRCTYFDFKGTELHLTSQGQDVGSGSETLECETNDDIPRIAFPTRNLIEILNHFSSERLEMVMTGAEGPCGITGQQDEGYTIIVMPMKIVDETYYSEEDA